MGLPAWKDLVSQASATPSHVSLIEGRWITDIFNGSLRRKFGKDNTPPKTRAFLMVNILFQCFRDPIAESRTPRVFHTFVSVFLDFFHVDPMRARSSSSLYLGSISHVPASFALQYHLRYFSPLGPNEPKAPSFERLFRDPIIRKRQVAWIGPGAESTGETGSGEGYFKERALSIIMYTPRGAFQLVFLCDEGTGIASKRWYGHTIPTISEGLDQLPGLGHFVTGMRRLLEWWHRGRNDTLAVIDGAVGFKVRINCCGGLKTIFDGPLRHFVDDMATRWTTPRTTMDWTSSCSMTQAS